MDKHEQLFIRACKSDNARRRVEKIYKRFYFGDGSNPVDLARVLLLICDKHGLYTAFDLANDLAPANAWKYGDENTGYWDRLVAVLVSKIRLTSKSTFEGLATPARFRVAA
jgi:hypothetical protein